MPDARSCRATVLSLLLLSAMAAQPAHSQGYPNKAVKVVTQGAAGSGPDVIARLVTDQLSRMWGQQVVILNHPGAGGSAAARVAAQGAPDGYDLYMAAISSFIAMPEMFPNLPIDLNRDFMRLGLMGEQPMVFAVSPSLGVNTLAELVALSKAKPGTILYAANARGTFPNLTVERFKKETGADFTFIPYPGAAAGLQDLMGGRISMIAESIGVSARRCCEQQREGAGGRLADAPAELPGHSVDERCRAGLLRHGLVRPDVTHRDARRYRAEGQRGPQRGSRVAGGQAALPGDRHLSAADVASRDHGVRARRTGHLAPGGAGSGRRGAVGLRLLRFGLGLDRQVGARAPFGPGAVVERLRGLADRVEREPERGRGHARAAARDDGLVEIDPGRRRTAPCSCSRGRAAVGRSEVRYRHVEGARHVAATQSARGSGSVPAKRSAGCARRPPAAARSRARARTLDVRDQLVRSARRSFAVRLPLAGLDRAALGLPLRQSAVEDGDSRAPKTRNVHHTRGAPPSPAPS